MTLLSVLSASHRSTMTAGASGVKRPDPIFVAFSTG